MTYRYMFLRTRLETDLNRLTFWWTCDRDQDVRRCPVPVTVQSSRDEVSDRILGVPSIGFPKRKSRTFQVSFMFMKGRNINGLKGESVWTLVHTINSCVHCLSLLEIFSTSFAEMTHLRWVYFRLNNIVSSNVKTPSLDLLEKFSQKSSIK